MRFTYYPAKKDLYINKNAAIVHLPDMPGPRTIGLLRMLDATTVRVLHDDDTIEQAEWWAGFARKFGKFEVVLENITFREEDYK